MFSLLAAIISGVLGIVGLGLGSYQVSQNVQAQKDANSANLQMNEETNKTNLEIARETNAANVEQANLSYQRSLPVNQVRNMMQAGVSEPAALAALTGGGSYSAPVLSAGQTQAGHVNPVVKDFSKITESLDRLGNIPGNVQQAQLMQQQLDDAKQIASLRMAEETRKQEIHEFDMWQKMYGKNAAVMIDELSSKIVSMAADKGISLDSIDSIDKLVNSFDLGHDKTWRSMPAGARNQVLEGVRSQAAENRALAAEGRAAAAEGRAATAAADAHEESLQRLKQFREDYNNSVKEHKTQDKERAVREARSKVEQILAERKGAREEFLQSLNVDDDGKITLRKKVAAWIHDLWTEFADVLGVEMLSDILRSIVRSGVPK